MRKRNKTIIKADRIEHLDVAKVHNPRYLVSRDGEEVGIFPGYNALMAINAARKIYGAGKYSSTKTGEAMYLGRGALETERREREERTARAAAKAAAKRDKIQLPKKSRTRRNPRRGSRAWDGSTEVQSRFTRILSSRGKLDLYKDGIEGKEVNYDRIPGGSFAFQYAVGRVEPGGEIAVFRRRADERGTYGGWRWETDQNKIIPYASTSTSGTKNLNRRRALKNAEFGGKRNPAEKDSEHPIEVTKHYRGGPPGYLSPWQKAMAIGQQELFDTGIKLAPRAAELRARISNPGATKPVYQSGLKQATAGQLPRLARVGLRVGHSPAEIRSDLATTGRFSAEQIRRAIDQATTAERRSNPGFSIPDYKATPRLKKLLESYYNIRLLYRQREIPNKSPWYLKEAHDEAKKDVEYILSRLGDEEYTIKLTQDAIRNTRDLMLEHEKMRERQRRGLPPQQRRNPPVRQIFETFNGRPATKTTSVQAPRRTPGRVAQLGRLRLIRTADGRTWRFPGERAPFLAADSRGKLHVVGGQYRANPAGEQCGEIEQIEYQTSKPHLGHDNETIYYHQLGEETGERPLLEITPEGELQIVGGDYRIEADGIHN